LQPSVPQLSVPSTNIPKGMWDSFSLLPINQHSLFFHSTNFISLTVLVNNKKKEKVVVSRKSGDLSHTLSPTSHISNQITNTIT